MQHNDAGSQGHGPCAASNGDPSEGDKMNDVLEQMLTEGTAIGEDGNTVQIFTASISREDGEALAKVIKATGARRTLEIGFAYGVSTLFILDALKESGGGHHTAIDPFEADGYGNVGLRSVQRAGFEDSFTFQDRKSVV